MMRLALVALVAGTTCLQAQEQAPRFRSSADAVRVDVQVRQGGKPIVGLTAADFELRDSKVPQEIQAVAIEDVPVTLILALDTSSSVKGPMLEQLKAAARAAVGALRDDDQAALLTFSQRIQRPATLTRDRQAINSAIDRMQAEGSTALRDTIFAATALREQAPGRVILLVFTDGVDTASWLDPRSVVNAALRSDIVIYGVSTNRGQTNDQKSWYVDEPELFPGPLLDDLTDRTGGELLQVNRGRGPGKDLREDRIGLQEPLSSDLCPEECRRGRLASDRGEVEEPPRRRHRATRLLAIGPPSPPMSVTAASARQALPERDVGLGFDLDQHRVIDERTDLDHRRRGRISPNTSPWARPTCSQSRSMFTTNMRVRTTSFRVAPALASAASTLRSVRTVCAYASSPPATSPLSLVAVVPDTHTCEPIRTARE